MVVLRNISTPARPPSTSGAGYSPGLSNVFDPNLVGGNFNYTDPNAYNPKPPDPPPTPPPDTSQTDLLTALLNALGGGGSGSSSQLSNLSLQQQSDLLALQNRLLPSTNDATFNLLNARKSYIGENYQNQLDQLLQSDKSARLNIAGNAAAGGAFSSMGNQMARANEDVSLMTGVKGLNFAKDYQNTALQSALTKAYNAALVNSMSLSQNIDYNNLQKQLAGI
jgi:hypothetical protein